MAYTLSMRDQSTFTQWVSNDYIRLLQPFDPTNFGKDTLARDRVTNGMQLVLHTILNLSNYLPTTSQHVSEGITIMANEHSSVQNWAIAISLM